MPKIVTPLRAQNVSVTMKPRKRIQPVPVMTFRPGTGHEPQCRRLASRRPPTLSMNGHRSSPITMSGGMTSYMISSGPSFSIWNSQRKYQSGRGRTTARGSADCSSAMFC